MDIYLDALRLGIYPTLFTSPSGDSCIIYLWVSRATCHSNTNISLFPCAFTCNHIPSGSWTTNHQIYKIKCQEKNQTCLDELSPSWETCLLKIDHGPRQNEYYNNNNNKKKRKSKVEEHYDLHWTLGQNAFNSIIELKAFLTVLEFHWIEQSDVQYVTLWPSWQLINGLILRWQWLTLY